MEQSQDPLLAVPTLEKGADTTQEGQEEEEEVDEHEQSGDEQEETPEAGEVSAVALAALPASPDMPNPAYTYEKTTIVLVVQFRPKAEEGQPRPIWLSAQNGVGNEQDIPLFELLTEAELDGTWPAAVTQLLERLRQDLPERQRRAASRQANRPAVASAPPAARPASARTASSTAAKPKPPAGAAAPPPVPTATNPIAKSGLAMPGLFEGIDEEA